MIMNQKLVITKTAKQLLRKAAHLILPVFMLLGVTLKSNGQTNALFKINKVVVSNEKDYGKVNGIIEIYFENQPAPGNYKVTYDLHAVGNSFSVSNLSLTNENKLILSNLRSGSYFNLTVKNELSGKTAVWSQNFTISPAKYESSNFGGNGDPGNLTCSGSINYTDCNNVSRTTPSSLTTDKGYNSTSSGTPCGYEVSASCTVVNVNQWHCLDGNLSAPPSNNAYTITNYTGAGLTALQACRINWVVCNYFSINSNVSNAIWKICGTGGSANTIYNEAVAAVPTANGAENQMVFYKSGNSSYQDMCKWVCNPLACTGRVTSLYFNELNGGADLPITNGASFNAAQLGTLYNLEAGTSGTIGSVKYTITGPTPSSNIENTIPYNNPTTGSGAWTGAVGTYTVNLKTYSAADATGTLCHDTTITFTLVSGTTGSIGDRVWLDANGNGLQDATETGGITGVTVQLRNAANTVIATQNTNASGNYLFTGLAAGTYTVVFPVSLAGSVVTTANVGTNDNIDSDPSQTTGVTPNIVLAAGQNITNVDAGYCPVNLQIGNRVWFDANSNGLNEATENGISSVTVNLYKDNNNDNYPDTTTAGNPAVIATTATDASGNYLFSNLAPGNYIVGIITPSGYIRSSTNGGDPDNDINLDNNGIYSINGGETLGLGITLVGGTENDGSNTNTNTNNTYDFGFVTSTTSNTFCTSSLLTNSNGYYGGFEIIPHSLNLGSVSSPNPAGSELTLITSGNISADKCIIASNGNSIPGGISLAPHSGNWLLLLHPKLNNERLWFKTVTVTPGTTYNFCAWGGGSKTDPASMTLKLFMNGVNVGTGTITNAGSWTQVCGSYTVPAGVTSMEISIQDPTAGDGGPSHFVALDDICFSPQTNGTGSIGDRVWLDANGNGLQDATETGGITGVTVQLRNAANPVNR